MKSKIISHNVSPYLLVKESMDSKYNVYNALNNIRVFCNKYCPLLQIDSKAKFIMNGNPYNDLIANSLNQLGLGDLNYCLCDFLNSKIEGSDITFLSDFMKKVKYNNDDKMIDHRLLSLFHMQNHQSDTKAFRELLPFYISHSSNENEVAANRNLGKDSYISEDEMLHMMQNYLMLSFDIARECTNKLFAFRFIDSFDSEISDFTLNICEGLNFVRIFNKPCIFNIKVKSTHFSCFVLPLFGVNKYKFLTISRPYDDLTTRILNEIRRIARDFCLLRDDFFLSGQYVNFDYKFNANFDVKTVLSFTKIIDHYVNSDSPYSVRRVLDDMDDWNNHPFSFIEEFINSIYGMDNGILDDDNEEDKVEIAEIVN